MSIYFIVGPTAIGKSDLALRIAQHINGEIINADSMQVYKNLNILTARPQKQDLKKIKHHLYGHIEGFNRYNVSNWCNESLKIIKKNNNKKSLIFVGGTGMYIDKLINGLFNIPTIPEKLKKQSEKELNKLGINKFYEEVIKVDKEATIKINSNDSIRLRRIWEIFMHTKIPMSTWTKKNEKKFIQNDDYYLYLFLPNREKNYERVNNRFVKMVESGAINEVKSLLKLNLDKSLPIMKAHGVPELSSYIMNDGELEECIKDGQKVTRNYVKRQHTWWNSSTLKIHQKITEFPDEIDIKMINFN